MLTPQNLAAEVARLAQDLPPFPKVVMRLLDMLQDDNTSLEALAHLASHDAVILSGLLAKANQIRHINAQPDVHDPFVAASLIGFDQVRSIVATAGMHKFLAEEKGATFLFLHSRAVAIVAQELATMCGISSEKAYVASILHDIGQLCLHILDPGAFEEIYQQSAIDGRLVEREAAVFGQDHTEIGAALARHWQLPEDFVEAIRAHHDDDGVTGSPLQAVVNVAESLVRALDIPPSPKNRLTRLNSRAVAALGIDWHSQEMSDCFGRCRARFHQTLD
ncbi:hypothetical protein B9N43_14650 [Denitratisoma sp. DHT3]|uniref:HDOD domain-containing protein n=1 Tax=Denitratisoma sp. DHT3 TaxID=1981880 RepID=UPI0011987B3D|nr:HDOD domain-containing protein [Denitratisoma sp. DHT3]QDX82366.1 hypothetical protein B9N43_14650 [Denitratisoma sp. DHT3]